MTDIAGVGSFNADILRTAAQNQSEGRQSQLEQAQAGQDDESLEARRVERAEQGARSNDDLDTEPDFSADDIRQAAVTADADERQTSALFIQDDIQVRANEASDAVQVTLSEAAQQSQQQAVRIASQDAGSAEQSLQDGIRQTEDSLNSDDFTRIIDQNRERQEASSSEERATRELGRVIDTFA